MNENQVLLIMFLFPNRTPVPAVNESTVTRLLHHRNYACFLATNDDKCFDKPIVIATFWLVHQIQQNAGL